MPADRTVPFPSPYPEHWEPVGKKFTCRVCADSRGRLPRHILEHEITEKHKERLAYHLLIKTDFKNGGFHAAASTSAAAFSDSRSPSPTPGPAATTDPAVSTFARAFSTSPSPPPQDAFMFDEQPDHTITMDIDEEGGINLDDFWDVLDMTVQQPLINQQVADLATVIQEITAGDRTWSEDEAPDHGPDIEEELEQAGDDQGNQGRRRTRGYEVNDPVWSPWDDKITYCIDVMQNLPRSAFSDAQLDVLKWGMSFMGVDDVPSKDQAKAYQKQYAELYGVESKKHKGALGNLYYLNSLNQIVAREMGNPLVRPHLNFYPENAGDTLEHAWQGTRWRDDMDPELLTPMVRVGNADYFVHEPALVWNQETHQKRVVVPVRFVVKEGKMFGRVWSAEVASTDVASFWTVNSWDEEDVPMEEFTMPYPTLRDSHQEFGIPDPADIRRIYHDAGRRQSSPWTHPLPNKWRTLAMRDGKPHRVASFMIWLYCDDTSGNKSKKWNKHNSFLFTPAGLPSKESQREYNVHFLSTSNIAPPLEMLDGIADELEYAQEHGIWAWDCVYQEFVLVFPCVLAMLGDNPMQSEFACHIGLRGKLFCRICKVWGRHEDDLITAAALGRFRTTVDGTATDMSEAESGDDSDASTGADQPPRKKGARPAEPLGAMIERTLRFLRKEEPRTKLETVTTLHTMFDMSREAASKTRVKELKTEEGVKDTYLDVFLNRIFGVAAKKTRVNAETAIDAEIRKMPQNIFSPVWRIRGLDPHRDTPVEILHVILLGFVKYLWRDVIARLKPEQKTLLAIRLSAFDVSGLGLSELPGFTLVQYAGSLTGRDFRTIAQVAPHVIYDMVPSACYQTWLALSAMVPLVWQPKITNLEAHLVDMEAAIAQFLNCAARWTPRWFNKAKFHILLHLPDHIRQFGPAILFATEAFESFNAVIRAKSILSNRQAPSRDIGRDFVSEDRLRHCLSGANLWVPLHVVGGYPRGNDIMAQFSNGLILPQSPPRLNWPEGADIRVLRPVGVGPLASVSHRNIVTHYLGMNQKVTKSGHCVSDKKKPRHWRKTTAGRYRLHHHLLTELTPTSTFQTSELVYLKNGDKCPVGAWVLFSDPSQPQGRPKIGRVVEVLQVSGSRMYYQGFPDFIFVCEATMGNTVLPFHMPSVHLNGGKVLVTFDELLCTVNVVHNCAANKCDDSGTMPVWQEQEELDYTRPTIRHNKPRDRYLNTCQMRDAIHLQQFQRRPTPLDRLLAVQEGAAVEVRSRKGKGKQPATEPSLVPEVGGQAITYGTEHFSDLLGGAGAKI